MMRIRCLLPLAAALLAGGCAAYSLVEPGPVTVGGLQVTPGVAWNRGSSTVLPSARRGTAVWTRDGLTLDRLLIIPAVPDGEAIFQDRTDRAALPLFRADMLPNELEELAESSVVKLYGEGTAVVRAANLRPHRYGDDRGILFDLDARMSEGPDYRGLAGAFVADEKLYLMLYLAAVPYYYDRHLGEAESIIMGARRVM